MNDKTKSFLDQAYAMTDSTSIEEVRAVYDNWAASYESNLVAELGYVMPERAADALTRFAPNPAVRVLDVGCGTGLSGLAAKRAGYLNIDGCDLSPGMLEHAARTNVYGRLFEANLLTPPIDVEDGFYDVAFAVGVFSYGHLNPDATGEVLRTVKPGGVVILTVNDHYEEDGKLLAKLRELEAAGDIELLAKELGEHIQVENIGGWVFVAKKI